MKTIGRNWFQIVCFILTFCAILLIGGNILVIVLRGGKSLIQCLESPNTSFALWLSIKTAAISTFFCFLLAVPTAYTLVHIQKRISSPVEIALELTMSLPNIVLGLSLLILCSSILGDWLKTIGLPIVFSQNGINNNCSSRKFLKMGFVSAFINAFIPYWKNYIRKEYKP